MSSNGAAPHRRLPFRIPFGRGPGAPAVDGAPLAPSPAAGAPGVSVEVTRHTESRTVRDSEPDGDGAPGAMPVAAPGDAHPGDADDPIASGVHAITKKTDYWFEREVHGIERQATESAHAWADKGLPRHDVPRTEPLEPEQVLAKLCAQTFRQWQLRVRTRMHDAIEETCRDLGEHVATLRQRVSRLDVLRHELERGEERIEKLRRQIESDDRPVTYAALIPGWGFWLGAVLLALVEFTANFPVFRLLLPASAEAARAAADRVAEIDPADALAGLKTIGVEWGTHLEAVVVAAVAVIVLVVLGKFVGRAARARYALDAADYPAARQTVRAHQREFHVKLLAGAAGLACALGFLFLSRDNIAEVTARRVASDSTAVVVAERALGAATVSSDLSDDVPAQEGLAEAREVLALHTADAAYADVVAQNNLPILLLNLALVITAALLGYAHAAADLSEKRGENPDLAKLRERCADLRHDQLTVDHEARAAAGAAHAAIARVQQLLQAHPLRGWESKVHRLESVIPRFRGENARHRGLDPANIRAFDGAPVLDLPPLDHDLPLLEPAEFARLCTERRELLLALERLAPRGAARAVV